MTKPYTKQELERRLNAYFNHGRKDAVFVPYMIKEFVGAAVEAMRNRQESLTIPIELAVALACFLETEQER